MPLLNTSTSFQLFLMLPVFQRHMISMAGPFFPCFRENPENTRTSLTKIQTTLGVNESINRMAFVPWSTTASVTS